ncbi:MAG: sialidase family protein [Verrucomicrobiales bacterium]|nr:sialidase family protein [Verrucomicrobiales bacterium]
MEIRSSRRKFLAGSLASATAPLILASSKTHEVLEIKTISQQDEYYHGWPTVGQRSNGDLFVVWSGRRVGHICPFGTVESMHSRDEGKTWSYPRTIHDSLTDDRDAGVLETAQGTLLVTSFTSLAYESYGLLEKHADDPAWQAAHARLPDDESRKAELGCWMFRSTDGGKTFSNRIDTVVNSPHGPTQLSDGRLLYLGKRLWTEDKPIGASVSEDDGQSWSWLSGIPTREGDTVVKGYHELHAVECADGSILAQIRNHNEAHKGETLQCRSTDGGKTWSVPETIGVWGLPSHLLRLRDDRLVMSYGYRRKPYGNQARISEDHGKTWSAPYTISDDGPSSDLGYPSTVELSDGSLLTVWYEKMPDSSMARLRQAKWKIE